MTFPIRRGKIYKNFDENMVIHNHDSEELMQNGIFSTGDEFDIET